MEDTLHGSLDLVVSGRPSEGCDIMNRIFESVLSTNNSCAFLHLIDADGWGNRWLSVIIYYWALELNFLSFLN
jgi:hypothetical protein